MKLTEKKNSGEISQMKKKERIREKLIRLFNADFPIGPQNNDIFYNPTSKPLISKIIFEDDDNDNDNSEEYENEEILENVFKNIFTWKRSQNLQSKCSQIEIDNTLIQNTNLNKDQNKKDNNTENNKTRLLELKTIEEISSNTNVTKESPSTDKKTEDYIFIKVLGAPEIHIEPIKINLGPFKKNRKPPKTQKKKNTHCTSEKLEFSPKVQKQTPPSEDLNKKTVENKECVKFPRIKVTERRNIPKYTGKMAAMVKHISTENSNKIVTQINNDDGNNIRTISSKATKRNTSGDTENHSFIGNSLNDNNFDLSLYSNDLDLLSSCILIILLTNWKISKCKEAAPPNMQQILNGYFEVNDKYYNQSYCIIRKHYPAIENSLCVKHLLKLGHWKLHVNKLMMSFSESMFLEIFIDLLKLTKRHFHLSSNVNNTASETYFNNITSPLQPPPYTRNPTINATTQLPNLNTCMYKGASSFPVIRPNSNIVSSNVTQISSNNYLNPIRNSYPSITNSFQQYNATPPLNGNILLPDPSHTIYNNKNYNNQNQYINQPSRMFGGPTQLNYAQENFYVPNYPTMLTNPLMAVNPEVNYGNLEAEKRRKLSTTQQDIRTTSRDSGIMSPSFENEK